ncbi:MAG: hypothetical protein IKJ57_02360, partial [Oscillospiraceae bacterium]|nr:hypothetical protein [Oscillospiraceae bacterium]
PSAYIDVTSLSPVMLVQIEVGSGKSYAGIPVWVWIVIAVVVIVMIALVALFLLNRSNERKREALNERQSMAQRTYHTSSGITGFDDEE